MKTAIRQLLDLGFSRRPKPPFAVIYPENRVIAISADELRAAKHTHPCILRGYRIQSISYRENGYATVWLRQHSDNTPR